MPELAVLVKDAVKKYGRVLALRGVSLNVEDGSIVAILGPNGAGKTTLLRAIGGSLRLDSGHITVYGVDATRNPLTVRMLVGFVPEENIGFPELSVRDNLVFAGRLYGLTRREALDRAREIAEALEFHHYLDRRLAALSKGFRRRVTIGLALLHDPRLLVLDEPFSGLDPLSAMAVRDLIVRLNREGRTVVIATHSIGLAVNMASHIYILAGGRIIGFGDRERIRRMLGWRAEAVAIHVEPEGRGELLARRLQGAGLRASARPGGTVMVVGELWPSLLHVVEECKRLECEVVEMHAWQLTWEELFARFVGSRPESGGCPCCAGSQSGA